MRMLRTCFSTVHSVTHSRCAPGWWSSRPDATSEGADSDATTDARPMRARLMSLLVRPTTPPLWLGAVVAASFIVAETLLVRLLMRTPNHSVRQSVPDVCHRVVAGNRIRQGIGHRPRCRPDRPDLARVSHGLGLHQRRRVRPRRQPRRDGRPVLATFCRLWCAIKTLI